MTAFVAAIDSLFADPNLSRDAIYRMGGTDPDIPIRIVLRRPDAVGTFGETRIVAETVVIDVRVSEIAAPVAGDTFTIGGETFVVHGEPVRDRATRCAARKISSAIVQGKAFDDVVDVNLSTKCQPNVNRLTPNRPWLTAP